MLILDPGKTVVQNILHQSRRAGRAKDLSLAVATGDLALVPLLHLLIDRSQEERKVVRLRRRKAMGMGISDNRFRQIPPIQ